MGFEINRFLGVWFPAHDTLLLPIPGNKKAETRGWISAKIRFSKAIDWVFIAFTKPTAEPSEWENKGAAQFATSLLEGFELGWRYAIFVEAFTEKSGHKRVNCRLIY